MSDGDLAAVQVPAACSVVVPMSIITVWPSSTSSGGARRRSGPSRRTARRRSLSNGRLGAGLHRAAADAFELAGARQLRAGRAADRHLRHAEALGGEVGRRASGSGAHGVEGSPSRRCAGDRVSGSRGGCHVRGARTSPPFSSAGALRAVTRIHDAPACGSALVACSCSVTRTRPFAGAREDALRARQAQLPPAPRWLACGVILIDPSRAAHLLRAGTPRGSDRHLARAVPGPGGGLRPRRRSVPPGRVVAVAAVDRP